MENEEILRVSAVADVLAEVIAFLLPYKSKIREAQLTGKRNKKEKVSHEIYGNIQTIESEYKRIRDEETNPITILIECFQLIIELDKMIGESLVKLISNNCTFLEGCYFVRIEKGLNSEESRISTGITIIPRFKTMWEGSGEDREIESESYNRMLNNSRYVELKDSLVAGKYVINCVLLSRDDAIHPSCWGKGDNALRVGMSPMSMLFDLKRERDTGVFFYQEPWNENDIAQINAILWRTIKRAEEEKINILVFPEMLGYEGIEEQAYKYIRDVDCKYLKLVVLPSGWKKEGESGTNTSHLVHAGNAEKVFSQGKLVAYNNDEMIEAINPSDTINLLFDEVHGCLAILICKSELEESVRDTVVRELGAKLIICPSWSTGTYPFETTAMANAQWNANLIWTNTCSAFKSKKYNDMANQPVCMVTHYCKKPHYGKLKPEKFYPRRECKKKCLNGEPCLFVSEIKGYIAE